MRVHTTLKLLSSAMMAIALAGCAAPTRDAPFDEAAAVEPASQHGDKLVRMFFKADADYNGHLTRAEARRKLPLTHAHFDEIDYRKQGSITIEQFLAFHEMRTQRAQAEPPSPPAEPR